MRPEKARKSRMKCAWSKIARARGDLRPPDLFSALDRVHDFLEAPDAADSLGVSPTSSLKTRMNRLWLSPTRSVTSEIVRVCGAL